MALKLGKLLIDAGLVTKEQLNKGLQAQRLYGGKLGTNLVELGFISDTELAAFLAKQLNMPAAQQGDFERIPQPVLDLVPKEFAGEHKLIPIRLDQKLHVAISDPSNLNTLDELSFRCNKGIHAVIAPEIWVVAALERYYGLPRELRYISVSEEPDAGVGEMSEEMTLIGNESVFEEETDEDVEKSPTPLASYLKELAMADRPERLFHVLLEFLAPLFPRIAVFAIRRDTICGLMVRGFPIHNKAFAETSAPLAAVTLIRSVAQSGKPYTGPLPTTPEDEKLLSGLQIPPARAIGLYPLPYEGKTAAVLLGVPDKEHGPPRPEAGRLVPDALAKAGLALEILAQKRRLQQAETVPRS